MRSRCPVLAVAAWAAPAPAYAQVAYTKDLGVLTNGQVEGLNAAGQIIGVTDFEGVANGFRAGADVLVSSPAANLGGDSDAMTINASGQVSGVATTGRSGPPSDGNPETPRLNPAALAP